MPRRPGYTASSTADNARTTSTREVSSAPIANWTTVVPLSFTASRGSGHQKKRLIFPTSRLLRRRSSRQIRIGWVWGSDWPHPRFGYSAGTTHYRDRTPFPVDDGLVLNQLPKWTSDAAMRRKILVDNAARLYDFADADDVATGSTRPTTIPTPRELLRRSLRRIDRRQGFWIGCASVRRGIVAPERTLGNLARSSQRVRRQCVKADADVCYLAGDCRKGRTHDRSPSCHSPRRGGRRAVGVCELSLSTAHAQQSFVRFLPLLNRPAGLDRREARRHGDGDARQQHCHRDARIPAR